MKSSDGAPLYEDVAARGLDVCVQELEKRGLAGSGTSRDQDELAPLDAQVDSFQGGTEAAVALRDIAKLDHGASTSEGSPLYQPQPLATGRCWDVETL